MKKAPGEVIILHMCTKNYNHYDVCFLRYGVRQTKFFVILEHFLPFYPTNDPEN